MGRPPVGKVAMTGAERVRRYRLKHGKPAKGSTRLKARIRELEALIRELTTPDLTYLADDEDLQGDTPEQQWQFAVANFCGDIIARRAFWTRTFGPDWETFSVPPDLKVLLLEAEAAFEAISSALMRRSRRNVTRGVTRRRIRR